MHCKVPGTGEWRRPLFLTAAPAPTRSGGALVGRRAACQARESEHPVAAVPPSTPEIALRLVSPRLAGAIIVLAAAVLWVALSPPGANDVVGGDEGYYGTQARNILYDPRHLVSPSLTPGGGPGDKPPLYPALLALSVRILGPTEAALRWPSLLCTVLVALFVARLAAMAGGPWVGVAAAGLFVALPIIANFSRVAAAEHPLTALGAGAVAWLAGGRGSARRALAAGALLGLAFLCKLWLAVLLALPAVALLLPPGGEGRRLRAPAAFALAGAAVALLQLAAVALFAPQDLAHWWSVYWSFSLASRLDAAGFADYWIQPPGFYWTTLAHALVLALPLAALGLEGALRRFREPVPRALVVWALGPLLLSIFRVKSGGYLYPALPAWAALAALGLAAIVRGEARPRFAFALFALASAPPVTSALGGPTPPPAAWVAAWTACILVLAVARARQAWRLQLAISLGSLIAMVGIGREVQRLRLHYHDPGYRFVGRSLAPLLAGADRARPSYIAPEAPAFAYYLDRAGQYWSSPYIPWTEARFAAIRADTALRAFVVDPSQSFYGGWPDSAALRWLETGTREITGDIEARAGRAIAVRVFTRDER